MPSAIDTARDQDQGLLAGLAKLGDMFSQRAMADDVLPAPRL